MVKVRNTPQAITQVIVSILVRLRVVFAGNRLTGKLSNLTDLTQTVSTAFFDFSRF